MTPVFALYMHREEHDDAHVTACKCSFFRQYSLSLVLFYFFSFINLVVESQVNFSNKNISKCKICVCLNTAHQHVVCFHKRNVTGYLHGKTQSYL